jgi:hypothetical protein
VTLLSTSCFAGDVMQCAMVCLRKIWDVKRAKASQHNTGAGTLQVKVSVGSDQIWNTYQVRKQSTDETKSKQTRPPYQ